MTSHKRTPTVGSGEYLSQPPTAIARTPGPGHGPSSGGTDRGRGKREGQMGKTPRTGNARANFRQAAAARHAGGRTHGEQGLHVLSVRPSRGEGGGRGWREGKRRTHLGQQVVDVEEGVVEHFDLHSPESGAPAPKTYEARHRKPGGAAKTKLNKTNKSSWACPGNLPYASPVRGGSTGWLLPLPPPTPSPSPLPSLTYPPLQTLPVRPCADACTPGIRMSRCLAGSPARRSCLGSPPAKAALQPPASTKNPQSVTCSLLGEAASLAGFRQLDQ